jgi:hypothetical protein
MANEIDNPSTGMNKARVESFSNGVFAFAITLLVLSITVPDIKVADDQLLASALLRAIPQLVPYVTISRPSGSSGLTIIRCFRSRTVRTDPDQIYSTLL